LNDSLPQEKICLIGLGYVGLPVAVAMARKFPGTVGYDISSRRIEELRAGHDSTGEIDSDDLRASSLTLTADPAGIADCTFYIVTVPTPIDRERRPDLGIIESACRTIAPHLKAGNVVVFESTVYPGVTEEICGPILQQGSGLVSGRDFHLGYSPERINPGDKVHRLETITKIVAGQDAATLDRIAGVYGTIVEAGLYRASSIRVAEAAKVIENTQRDINIALMNELAIICERLGLRTHDVLEAAQTKWNFLPFTPGLVGGHCIGVDPYYLTSKAEALGYHPHVILAGRRVNDNMGAFIAEKTVKLLVRAGADMRKARIGIFGLTFKENVPDLRNSKVVDIIEELRSFGIEPLVHDPVADPAAAMSEYGITLSQNGDLRDLDAAIFAVRHAAYVEDTKMIEGRIAENGILVDVKSSLDPAAVRPDITYWSL
jgi:UDP-N-acetyl-D-galactosamine dehydrogenase